MIFKRFGFQFILATQSKNSTQIRLDENKSWKKLENFLVDF
jgi:hypothetical protein